MLPIFKEVVRNYPTKRPLPKPDQITEIDQIVPEMKLERWFDVGDGPVRECTVTVTSEPFKHPENGRMCCRVLLNTGIRHGTVEGTLYFDECGVVAYEVDGQRYWDPENWLEAVQTESH